MAYTDAPSPGNLWDNDMLLGRHATRCPRAGQTVRRLSPIGQWKWKCPGILLLPGSKGTMPANIEKETVGVLTAAGFGQPMLSLKPINRVEHEVVTLEHLSSGAL